MSEIIISTEPATGAEIWSGPAGDPAAEVAAARAAWPEWAAHSVAYRMETLRRFVNVVLAKEEEFADLISRETGKPFWEAKTEVGSVMAKVDISIGAYSERTPMNRLEAALGNRIAIRHKPHGVLAVLGPYNFPAHLPNGHIVPALIAGNAVVFKPSEKTPATGAFLVDCFHEAGVPQGVLRLLIGGPSEGKALAAQPGIDGLLFTGSANAGMALHRQFAEAPHKILALELGGNNPIVAWDVADLPAAAAIIVQSAYLSAGQRCTAARRLIVEDGKHEKLVAEIVKLIDRIIVDHPHADPQPFMGPVIDLITADILQDRFLGLMMKGGKPIRRLDRPFEERPYLTPALIDMTDARDRLDEELFGPVLQLIRVKDFDAAIDEANNSRFGLAASILTKDPALYDRFWSNVRS
ncbi:MAG TPA: succinylglutamate-semialdehyde dehydrogenase, partial [Sphingomicrobium sp.]|nr:succinylglutamate-semialdehyde dehydrogenase [Sphingomicrobium sp.]